MEYTLYFNRTVFKKPVNSERVKRIYKYIRLNRSAVYQKLTQHCKLISIKKINLKDNKNKKNPNVTNVQEGKQKQKFYQNKGK